MSENSDKKMYSILNFIEQYSLENNYAPSVRDICAGLNIKSTATVAYYIDKLTERGLLKKSDGKNRTVSTNSAPINAINIPLIGTVTAGQPIFATENFEDYYAVPSNCFKSDNLFMLNVVGESMIEAGIFNGDKIIVRKQETADNGDIVVALIDDSATVKRFYKRGGKVILHPENSTMSDIVPDTCSILGKVIGLIRTKL